MFSFIFLYKFSINNGTASIAVGFVSFKFGTMCFSPSHIAIDAPTDIGIRNPILDSYVWCNGNTEKNLSWLSKYTYAGTTFAFWARFLLFIITPFAFDVVPDVNINTLNSSGSIGISI